MASSAVTMPIRLRWESMTAARPTVAMRGIGPSLAGLGLTGTLQDPTLQLIDSKGVVKS